MDVGFPRKRYLASSSVEMVYSRYDLLPPARARGGARTSFADQVGRPAVVLPPELVEEIARALADGEIQIPVPSPPPPAVDKGLRRVLDRLRAAREEIQAEYQDVSRREQAWRTFQRLVTEPLWEAVEGLEGDPYRRQLADVLDAAVSRLQAFQLDEKHLSAMDLTLARLAAPRVTEDDVDACEDAWQAAAVDTVPALGDAFEEWLELSVPDLDDAG